MNWTTIRRGTGLIEHVCEHGIGHPNGASILRMTLLGPEGAKGSWDIHGCDGCCSRRDFPGNVVNTLIRSLDLYEDRELSDYLSDLDPVLYMALVWLRDAEHPEIIADNIGAMFAAYTDEQREHYKQKAEFMYWGLELARREHIQGLES